MENDLLQNEWDEVQDLLRRMTGDGTVVALLKKDGTHLGAPPTMQP